MDELEKRAREFAVASGHKNPDAEIVCVGGRREAVWRFYRDEAAEQLMRDQAAAVIEDEKMNKRTYVTMAGKTIGKCSSGHWLPLCGNCDLCGAGPDEKCMYTRAALAAAGEAIGNVIIPPAEDTQS